MNTYLVEVFSNTDSLIQTSVIEADTAKEAIDRVKARLPSNQFSYIYFTASSINPEKKRYDVFLYAGGKQVDRLQLTGNTEEDIVEEAIRTFSVSHGNMTGVTMEIVLQEHESLV